MKDQRSGIANANLQELLDAEANPNNLLMTGAAQYLTPISLAQYCHSHLPTDYSVRSILDPQAGECNLLLSAPNYHGGKYGVEIDTRAGSVPGVNMIAGNCVKFFEAVDDLFPIITWRCGVANPPFGKRWKVSGASGVADSTELTWKWLLRHCHYGFFIASETTIQKLELHKHPWVYKHETRHASEYWDNVSIHIGILWWKNPDMNRLTCSPWSEMHVKFEQLKSVLSEERVNRPPFNIYLDERGYLKTCLSTRNEIKLKLSNSDRIRLFQVNGAHPFSLTTEKETRTLLRALVENGTYTIQPDAKDAIEAALASVNKLSCPIMPVTDFERVAYADEEDTLLCVKTLDTGRMKFTAGRRYSLHTGTYKFSQPFKRRRVHFNEETLQTSQTEHDCMISGQDRYIAIRDDWNRDLRFMDRPTDKNPSECDERTLWDIFEQPTVRTLADTATDAIEHNRAILRSCEMVAGYQYYPGQLSYLSRVAAKPTALIAAATGTGKTLMAISLLAMKGPERALIIAPQGTMRSSESEDDEDDDSSMTASQWMQEITRFAPYLSIYELFSMEDYHRIRSNHGGTLPPGVYVSYFQAIFQNKARETAPASWNDEKLNKWAKANGYAPLTRPDDDSAGSRYWCDSIGMEKNGIRCIISPCMATEIGHLFDFVAVDEAHAACNLDAQTTQMLIRLQPKYRYAFTATPIPNVVSNLFSLMGWLAVPDWYKGGIRNAAWPYSREELGRFNSTFLSQERDFTQEEINHARDRTWKGKCVKTSPVIAAPARLLKLLKPTMAYISKEDCNPAYKQPKITDVRVRLGVEQAKLYSHYLNRANIPASHPLVRARKQVAWLRAICADPKNFRHSPPDLKVSSNMNPKIIAILELTRDILAKGEPLVIINSRIGITDTLQTRLADAGVTLARIDSTIQPDQHAAQANLFKQGKAQVMLMGIKCAASHSFDKCRYEIIGSIEYSPGPFNQAKGRIDRVNSRPDVNIICILNSGTIEEVMFDLVATKDDAATICLKGQRIPRDFKPVDASEILAIATDKFDLRGTTTELVCEGKWPELRKELAAAARQLPA